jgi:hypothetical protein
MPEAPTINDAPPLERRFQFGLRTMLALPLFVAVFGFIGVRCGWPAASLLLPIFAGVTVWLIGANLVESLIAGVTVGIAVALLLPEQSRAKGPALRLQCANNLKQIGLALHNYHDVFGSFPPAYVADEDGQPVHSWRVLLLPFLEQLALYDQYDFSQPWDSLANQQVSATVLDCYSCPSDQAGRSSYTNYVLVTGEGTAWHGDHAPTFKEFADGTSNTITVLEVVDSGIAWSEPRDLSLSQALRGVNATSGICISSVHPGGAHASAVDGGVHFLLEDLDSKRIRALISPDGGEKLGDPWKP